MSIINDISDALQRGKKKEVTKLVQQLSTKVLTQQPS